MTTGRDRPIEVMLSRHVKGKMPKDATPNQWREFHMTFEPFKTTAHGLAVEVWRGYSFTPMYSGRRKKENFGEAFHIAVDFDTADDRSSLSNLATIPIVRDYASFIYTTASHTPEHPKARVVWIFDETIMALSFYETLFKALLWRLPFADQGVKDGLRLYYGAPGCTILGIWNLLTNAAIDEIVDAYQLANPKKVDAGDKIIVKKESVSDTYLERKINIILDKLAAAPDGRKHQTIFAMARLLGGYVAGGYYSEDQAEGALKSVVKDLPNVVNLESAYKTISDGLEYGKRQPLYIESVAGTGEGM